jgi:dinuclear metal center YbgI/SA1388 family protein
MATLIDIVKFCNERVRTKEIKDFPGSFNGLQLENNGQVAKVGASVDAGLVPFLKASENGVDFLIVHHGLFWTPLTPLTGANYKKVHTCMKNNLAVYGSHLPLDCHADIGNNALLAKQLGLKKCGTFLKYEGSDIGLVTECHFSRDILRQKLESHFPSGIKSIEFGSVKPTKIAILTGSGQSAVDQIMEAGSDTLITGELKQQYYNLAQELKLNLYTCGHYATETFGVDALAKEVASTFGLQYVFIDSGCTL